MRIRRALHASKEHTGVHSARADFRAGKRVVLSCLLRPSKSPEARHDEADIGSREPLLLAFFLRGWVQQCHHFAVAQAESLNAAYPYRSSPRNENLVSEFREISQLVGLERRRRYQSIAQ